MFNLVVSVVVSFIVAVYSLDFYYRRPKDEGEPPYLTPGIPLIGHAVGLGKYGTTYYARVRYLFPELIGFYSLLMLFV
jgi:hypothetical protein